MSGIPAWAVPGAKCIFIGCPQYRMPQAQGFAVDALPQVGIVYTVRDTKIINDALNIRLVEMQISGRWPDGRPYHDAWLHTRAFRPPVEDSIETQLYRAKGRKSKAPVRESERV